MLRSLAWGGKYYEHLQPQTIGPLASPSTATSEPNLTQHVAWDGYGRYYPPYAYSRAVCRAWWKGCEWEPGHYWNYWPNRYYVYRAYPLHLLRPRPGP